MNMGEVRPENVHTAWQLGRYEVPHNWQYQINYIMAINNFAQRNINSVRGSAQPDDITEVMLAMFMTSQSSLNWLFESGSICMGYIFGPAEPMSEFTNVHCSQIRKSQKWQLITETGR